MQCFMLFDTFIKPMDLSSWQGANHSDALAAKTRFYVSNSVKHCTSAVLHPFRPFWSRAFAPVAALRIRAIPPGIAVVRASPQRQIR